MFAIEAWIVATLFCAKALCAGVQTHGMAMFVGLVELDTFQQHPSEVMTGSICLPDHCSWQIVVCGHWHRCFE